MKNIFFTLILLLSTTHFVAQESTPTMMLTGASFGVKENGWFELGCDAFRATALNKSVSAASIKDTGKGMSNGTFYTNAELDATDVFVIMHVHNQNVANTANLKENYADYTLEEIAADYAVAYDYVIKKYQADCANLKNIATSKYFGTESGKPATIVLCTHWHDSRGIYNPAIRTLAEKWNFSLVKWDDNIGFTKDVPDEGGSQASLKYASDKETISSIVYGWHPLRGKTQYIQQKMAEIFVIEMQNILGVIPVGVTAQAKSNVIREGEEAYVTFAFTGLAPWYFSYKVGEEQFDLKEITQSPLTLKVDIPSGSEVQITPLSVSNATMPAGTVSAPISIGYMDKALSPASDTFIHQANKDKPYYTEQALDLKIINSDNFSRETLVSFNIDDLDELDAQVALRLYFNELIYSPSTITPENHLIEVAGVAQAFTNLTWNKQPTNLEKITEAWILPSQKGSYVAWDVSDWVLKQIAAGESTVTFRLKVVAGGSGLFRFPSMEAAANKPELLTVKRTVTGIDEIDFANKLQVYPNPFNSYLKVNAEEDGKISIFSIDGQVVYQSPVQDGENEINTENLNSGIYLLNYETGGKSIANKIVKTP